MHLVDREGRFLPEIPSTMEPALAERLWQACSGQAVDFPQLNRFCFGTDHRDAYLGHYRQLGIAFCPDPSIRRESASGGVLTRVLTWLLERGEIAGAVVTGMDPRKPWLTRTSIARTPEEIREAAKSKYTITSVNEVLPEIEAFQGPLAYVGLPCQVHSIRKMQMAGEPSVAAIRYVFGPYCGNTLQFSSIISLLRSYGEPDYRQIVRLSFREGEWPGNTCIEMRSGRRIVLKKFHANYLIPFHIMKRCLLCTDLANEFTDLAGGDAWAPVYEERGKGFSLAVARSEEGERILGEMVAEGALEFEDIAREKALSMHSHGYDLKKRGAFIRIRYRRMLGLNCPEYGYQVKDSRLLRHVMELFIDLIFLVAGTRISRFLIERVKPAWMGAIFEKLRTHWKRMTQGIKRGDLVG